MQHGPRASHQVTCDTGAAGRVPGPNHPQQQKGPGPPGCRERHRGLGHLCSAVSDPAAAPSPLSTSQPPQHKLPVHQAPLPGHFCLGAEDMDCKHRPQYTSAPLSCVHLGALKSPDEMRPCRESPGRRQRIHAHSKLGGGEPCRQCCTDPTDPPSSPSDFHTCCTPCRCSEWSWIQNTWTSALILGGALSKWQWPWCVHRSQSRRAPEPGPKGLKESQYVRRSSRGS